MEMRRSKSENNNTELTVREEIARNRSEINLSENSEIKHKREVLYNIKHQRESLLDFKIRYIDSINKSELENLEKKKYYQELKILLEKDYQNGLEMLNKGDEKKSTNYATIFLNYLKKVNTTTKQELITKEVEGHTKQEWYKFASKDILETKDCRKFIMFYYREIARILNVPQENNNLINYIYKEAAKDFNKFQLDDIYASKIIDKWKNIESNTTTKQDEIDLYTHKISLKAFHTGYQTRQRR